MTTENSFQALRVLHAYSSLALFPGLHMGATKSKPKEPGQRSMSLDGTIGTGSDSGHFHHLGPAQQTQTPNRSPAVGAGRRAPQGQHQQAPTNTPELALFGGVDHTSTITSPQRGPLSGERHFCETGYTSVRFNSIFQALTQSRWKRVSKNTACYHLKPVSLASLDDLQCGWKPKD